MMMTVTGGPAARLAAALLAATVALTGCTQSSAPAKQTTAGDAKEVVTLNYWDWWVSQGSTIDNEIKLFEQAHPNIRIKKTTQVNDKYPELFQLAVKGNSAPDMFLIPEKPTFLDQVRESWFLPLNDFADAEWLKQFPEGSFAEGANIVNGKLYSAPYDGNAPWLQLYINTKVFKDAGLTNEKGEVKVPQSWEELRVSAKAISQQCGGKCYGYGFGNKQKFILPWQMMMVQYSGAPDALGGFDQRTGRFVWASNPVYQEWVEFFMGMKQDGSIVPNAMSMDDEMARAAFADGKFGMLIGGAWVQGGWKKTHPNFSDYVVARIPSKDGKQSSYFYRGPGGTSWAISKTTKHPQEAWEWFKWLHSKEAAARWVKDGNGLRVYPEVNRPEYAPTAQFAQYLQLKDDVKLAPAPNLAHPEMNDVKSQAVKPAMGDLLEGIYTGQITDAKAALRDLEARQNAELDRAIADAEARGVKLDRRWWQTPDWNLLTDYSNSMN